MIKQELDRIKERISNKDFLENKGLSNEVGIHVFCYKAEDELIVQDYIRRLKSEVNTPYRIIECDLYEVFLSLLEDKRIDKLLACRTTSPLLVCLPLRFLQFPDLLIYLRHIRLLHLL